MPEKLTRAIPEVSVRLDKFAKTKEFENYVLREFLPSSLTGEDKITQDVNQYVQHNENKAKDGKENIGKPTWRPRMFVSSTNGEPDIISIGDYVVLRPSITDQGCLVGGVVDRSASNVPDIVEATIRMSNDPTLIQSPRLMTEEQLADFRARVIQYFINSQTTYIFQAINEAAKNQLRNEGGTTPNDQSIHRYLLNQPADTPVPMKIRAEFESLHQLGKNQPFAFSVMSKKQKMDADFATFANNDAEFNTQPWSIFYPKETRQQAAIEVEWGGGLNGRFKLVIRMGAKSVVLFRRFGQQWKKYSDSNSVPAGSPAEWTDVMVYPVGRQIIVIFGSEINSAAIKNNAIIYNLDSEADIEGGKINVAMYGADMHFKYKNVIHVKSGTLISPPVSCGLENVENAWVNLDYVGKNHVGRDGVSEVTPFPLTDREKEAEKNNKPNITDEELAAIDSKSTGEFGVRVATGLPPENVAAGNILVYQLLTENLESGLIPLFAETQPESHQAAIFYPNSEGKDGQVTRYLKYAIVMGSCKGTQETLRIYSPAIEVMQTFAIGFHSTINMNPMPQIEASDVVHVSIQESLESISATVTLNNRKGRPSVGGVKKKDLGGKFTYDYNLSVPNRKKDSNFVGVKPITIRGGVQGGANFITQKMTGYIESVEDYENIPQPIRFRGYIVGREYSRPGSGTSTVVLHCEDCSRRAKDHITMNLPIFDGWCLAPDTMVLTTDGLFRIDDLHGKKFSVITSYEDSTPVVVDDCVVVKRGRKKLYNVKLKNGQSIRATQDHLFLRRSERKPRYSASHIDSAWEKLGSLKVGDEIKVSDGSSSRSLISDGKDYGYDELFGWMVGDGWYSQAKRLQTGILFAKGDEDAAAKLKPYWDRLVLQHCGQLIKGSTDDHGTTSYGSTNQKLAEYLAGWGFKPAVAKNKELPDYIWSASTQSQCAFLRGLFSADGGVISAHGKNLSVELTSASLKLVQQTQVLLTSLGMVSNISNHSSKDKKRRWYGLELNGRSVSAFMRHIGFNIREKNEKFEFSQVPASDKDFREIVEITEDAVDDVYDVSMPSVHAFYANGVYTHNCNLAAMYYLARDAGYPIEDIVINQDPHDPANFTTLYDLLVEAGNTPEKFEGPCFSGHVEGVPEGSKIMEGLGASTLVSNVLHAMLPLNIYKQQPNYMFPAGQNSWDCMASIREFTGFYLYPNTFGKIVYQPPEIAFRKAPKKPRQLSKKEQDKIDRAAGTKTAHNKEAKPATDILTYYEVPRIKGQHNPLGYNQFQSALGVSIQTDDIRNSLALFGLIQVASSPDDPAKLDSWSPHVVVKRPEDLNQDVDKPWFVPWLRWTIVKNPQWSDPRRNEQLAQELYNRLRRVQLHTKFDLWGSPAHYAYMVFKVDESLMDETGADQLEFVTTQVTHEFDARALTYKTSVSGEHLNFELFDFAPHVSGRPLAAYTPGWRPGKSPRTAGPPKV